MKNQFRSLLLFLSFFISLNIFAYENLFSPLMVMDTTYLFNSICDGDDYEWNGIIYTQSGIYEEVFINSIGEDSVVILELDILENDSVNVEYVICGGEESPLTGTIYENIGDLILEEEEVVIFENEAGCDSVVIAQLTVNPVWEIWAWGEGVVPFEYDGETITEPGFYSFEIDDCCTDEGCPIIGAFELYLFPNSTSELEKEIGLTISPNPFTSEFRIEFEVEKRVDMEISIHDSTGKEIKRLFSEKNLSSGTHELIFQPTDLANGIYFIHLELDGQGMMKKIIKL